MSSLQSNYAVNRKLLEQKRQAVLANEPPGSVVDAAHVQHGPRRLSMLTFKRSLPLTQMLDRSPEEFRKELESITFLFPKQHKALDNERHNRLRPHNINQ